MKRAADILEELHCPFIINQNRYNIFNRTIETNGLKQAAAERKKGIIAFSPLSQGMLTDRYLNGIQRTAALTQTDVFSMQISSVRNVLTVSAV